MISDKMLIYNTLEDTYSKCSCCKRLDHSIDKCSLLHFVPQREFLICRHLFSKPTLEREAFKRRPNRSMNSRS